LYYLDSTTIPTAAYNLPERCALGAGDVTRNKKAHSVQIVVDTKYQYQYTVLGI